MVDRDEETDEQVMYQTRKSWFGYGAIVMPLYVIFGFIVGTIGATFSQGNDFVLLSIIIGISAINIALFWHRSKLDYIIAEGDLVVRHNYDPDKSRTYTIERINQVSVDKGPIGRIFGYGDVRFSAEGEAQKITNISNPDELKTHLE